MGDNHQTYQPPTNQVGDVLDSFQSNLADNFQTTLIICIYIIAYLE